MQWKTLLLRRSVMVDVGSVGSVRYTVIPYGTDGYFAVFDSEQKRVVLGPRSRLICDRKAYHLNGARSAAARHTARRVS